MFAIFPFPGIGNASASTRVPMAFGSRQAGGVIGWTAAGLAASGRPPPASN